MGYTSDVVVAMNKRAYGIFIEELNALSPEKKKEAIRIIDWVDYSYTCPEGDVVFEWGGIKWYDNFVQDFAYKVINAEDDYLGDEKPGVVFVRVGEDPDDREYICSSNYDDPFGIYIKVTIEHGAGEGFDFATMVRKSINFEGEKE